MNLGIGASDVLGAWLYARFGLTFRELVAVNAGTTLLAIAVVPLLPRALVARRERDAA
jgi:hypothetical protein